jgi:uncharacterized protein (DUF305 family)
MGLFGALLAGAVALAGAHGTFAQGQHGSSHGDGMAMDPVRHYIEWMIPHHEDAITMANLAFTQSEHAEIRALAARIVQTQTDEISLMRRWYQQWYGTEVQPDPMMGSAMTGGPMAMAGLDAAPLDGARPFDKAFIEQMVPHHEMAVMGSTMMLPRIDRRELQELLQSIIVSQRAEIEQMRGWYQEWYAVSLRPTPMESHGLGHPANRQMGMTPGDHPLGATHGHQDVMHGTGPHGGGGMVGGRSDHPAAHATEAASSVMRQERIRERGAAVMPFALSQTTHRFQVLPDGGLQSVIANDPTNEPQITLIQQHLATVAARFQRGDFSDPARLDGAEMPGLSELAAAASRLEVVYTPLSDGGQIRYTSPDPTIVDALHRWFAAQLMDYGADAVDH